MKTKRFIKSDNMPPRAGIGIFVLYWLLLDRLAAPGWVYGVVFTLLGIIWVTEVWRTFVGTAVDLVGNDRA